jgi:uncharacterized protein YyaL (SSP411 family)
MSNHLSNENSPYLLQHAHNPVDWYPWGEEALTRARIEDKPIFLSIGYAACHWCHVMAHESFENPATAAIMNENYICIKVDREERPDLDSIYMSATTAMTGSGGWPMSVFLTPDQRPFFAGTYFPPTARYDMPAFGDLLTSIAKAWREKRQDLLNAGEQVTQYLLQITQPGAATGPALTSTVLDEAAAELIQSYDWQFGGWGRAPKFPQPMTIAFLLGRAARHGGQEELKLVNHVLSAMAQGGMYDVVGGGFARYSVDNTWKTPHFEKMLYDNAQLAQVYLYAYLLTGSQAQRRLCEETLDFILREMRHPSGGVYSSLDADSQGKEGQFYVWDESEIRSVLQNNFDLFEAAYGIIAQPRWEGKIILRRVLDEQTLAGRFKISPDEVTTRLSACHVQLLEARSRRVRPGTDDKVLVCWNAMALSALAEAGRYLKRTDYLHAAQQNAHFLLDNLLVNGRLLRSWREGQARHTANLEDYAALASGLLALYASDGDTAWYRSALSLADDMVARYRDPQGGFFDTPNDHEPLLVRPRDLQDNATPSGSALAAQALLQLAAYGDRPEWRSIAGQMLDRMAESMQRYPTAFAKWLCAADFALGPIFEVAIIGNPASAQTRALMDRLWQTYRPQLVAAIASDPPAPGSPALLNERPLLNGQPTAYVCQNFVCRLPVNTPEEMSEQLHSWNPSWM